MPEAQLSPKDLGPNIDNEGNLITAEQTDSAEGLDLVGVSFEQALPQIDQTKQTASAPYIELRQKIGVLPSFERNAINDILANYFSQLPVEQRDSIKSADVVQLLSGSTRPLNHWKTSQFFTDDGKFEKFILERLKPAVDGMTEDLQGEKNSN